jgi:predicted  nucleic acid-binding Zn-ribbon protein
MPLVISQQNTGTFTALSSAITQTFKPVQGKLFSKQMLKWGPFVNPKNPKERIVVDQEFADTMIRNFHKGVGDIVQMPVVDDKNQHTEDPLKNLGEVVDLYADEEGVWAVCDARKHAEDFGSTLIGASALFSRDYLDTITNEHMGPTLLHLGVTNRPYITNLKGFEEISLSNVDTNDDSMVLMSSVDETSTDGKKPMTKDELLAALKAEGIDVSALETQVADLQTALSAAQVELSASQEQVVSLSAASETDDRDATIVALSAEADEARTAAETLTAELATAAANAEALTVELSSAQTALAEAAEKLAVAATEAATSEVDALIKEARVLPKQRETMIRLARDDRETFESLLPDSAFVSFEEQGTGTLEDPHDATALSGKVDHYVALAANFA